MSSAEAHLESLEPIGWKLGETDALSVAFQAQVDELTKLAHLKDANVINDAQYEQLKGKLLA